MAITKESTEVLSKASLGPSTTTVIGDCTGVDLTKVSQLAIQCKGSFNASASNGVKIHIRQATTNSDGAYDSVDVGTNEDGYFTIDPEIAASKTVSVWPDFYYIRVLAENLDTTYTASNVKVNVIKQTVAPV